MNAPLMMTDLMPVADMSVLVQKHGKPVRLLPCEFNRETEDMHLVSSENGRNILLHVTAKADYPPDSFRVARNLAERLHGPGLEACQVTAALMNQVINSLAVANAEPGKQTSSPDGSVAIQQFDEWLKWAVQHDASDLHINIDQDTVCNVKARVNGMIVPFGKTFDPKEARSVLRAMYNVLTVDGSNSVGGELPEKDLASAAVRRNVTVDKKSYDLQLRMEFSPTTTGWDAVLRIADMNRFKDMANKRGNLEHLESLLLGMGYEPSHVDIIIRQGLNKRGMMIVAGEVGSGKTRLIYTLMTMLQIGEMVVRSIEDPVEAILPGVRQVDIGTGKNLAAMDPAERMALSQRYMASLLRLDPDMVLVGEIRNPYMASVLQSIHESGHSGFGTIHAPSALGVFDRLVSPSVGMELDAVCSKGFVRLFIAQNLLPKLCPHCALTAEEAIQRNVLQKAHVQYLDRLINNDIHSGTAPQGQPPRSLSGIRFRNPVGCPVCRPRLTPGICGRTVVCELVEGSRPLLNAIRRNDRDEAQRIASFHRKALPDPDCTGRDMLGHALLKVLRGEVDSRSIGEVMGESVEQLVLNKQMEQELSMERNGHG